MIRFYLQDKAPAEEQVYSVDWAKFLGPDTLNLAVTPTAEVLEGTAVIDTLTNKDATTTNFWIRGGVRGEVTRGLVHVTTTANQELEAEVYIGVR